MPVTILIPAPLRRFADGSNSIEVRADTAHDALAALALQRPELHRQLFDDQGRLRSFVSVFCGDENIRARIAAGQEVAIRDGDVLTLLLAIAGGSALANVRG
jgi:molybdopterin converting factor small subunit